VLAVVVDTNVIVSALLKPQSKPELVLRLFFSGYAHLYFSDDIMVEYREVLSRSRFRRYVSLELVNGFLEELKTLGALVVPQEKIDVIKADPSDNMFLECAVAVNADFLITGNLRHFPSKAFRRTNIVTPEEFLQIVALHIA
jgi:putative PIN family toxin of toxin-antitoxin system